MGFEIDSLDAALKTLRQLEMQSKMEDDTLHESPEPEKEDAGANDVDERLKALQQQRQTNFDLDPKGEGDPDLLDEALKEWSENGKMA